MRTRPAPTLGAGIKIKRLPKPAQQLALYTKLMNQFANPNHDDLGRFAPGPGTDSHIATLEPSQYSLLAPKPFNRMLKADTESAIMQTPNGKAFVEAIDDWANEEKTAQLRTQITKELKSPYHGNDKARAVIGALRGAAPDNTTLFRGLSVATSHAALAKKYPVGSQMDLNLSSFSTNHAVANGFSQPEYRAPGTTGKETRVMLAVTGTHKAVPIQNLTSTKGTYKELEHITGGRFRVTSIDQQQLGSDPKEKTTVIQLHQENTL